MYDFSSSTYNQSDTTIAQPNLIMTLDVYSFRGQMWMACAMSEDENVFSKQATDAKKPMPVSTQISGTIKILWEFPWSTCKMTSCKVWAGLVLATSLGQVFNVMHLQSMTT